MYRFILHTLLLTSNVRLTLGSASTTKNYDEGFRFSLMRSTDSSLQPSPTTSINVTNIISHGKKKLENSEMKVKEQQQCLKNDHLDKVKGKIKISGVDKYFPVRYKQNNMQNSLWSGSRIEPILPRKPNKGRMILDFGTGVNNGDTPFTKKRAIPNLYSKVNNVKEKMMSFSEMKSLDEYVDNHKHRFDMRGKYQESSNHTKALLSRDVKVRVSLDPASACRLFPILFGAFCNGINAFFGTLRFLAPLVLGRRAVNGLGGFISDYMTGRYFRQTYTHLERAYLHFYEMPAAFRALCRISAQTIIYYILSKIMSWLVGIDHPPCHSDGRGLATFCSSLYITAILGTGHAFTTWVSVWGGPLRIQAVKDPKKHPTFIDLISRPWVMFKWLVDPEEWLSRSSLQTKPRFDPNPLLFPATWIPLHVLHIYAISKVLATDPDNYTFCCLTENHIPVLLKQYFIQQTLGDEWYRVFLGEMRVGLGIAIIVSYFVALIWSVVTSARMNAKTTLLMVPSIIAVIISAWMNIIIFYNRVDIRQRKRKRSYEVVTLR